MRGNRKKARRILKLKALYLKWKKMNPALKAKYARILRSRIAAKKAR